MKVEFIDRFGASQAFIVCDIHYDGLVHTHAVALDGKSSNGSLQVRALRGAMAELEAYLSDAESTWAQFKQLGPTMFAGAKPMNGIDYDVLSQLADELALETPSIPGMR